MVGRHAQESDAVDTSVAGIADARWGVRPEPRSARFAEFGWSYEEPTPLPCPTCGSELHALRKLYDGPHRNSADKLSFLVAGSAQPARPHSRRETSSNTATQL